MPLCPPPLRAVYSLDLSCFDTTLEKLKVGFCKRRLNFTGGISENVD